MPWCQVEVYLWRNGTLQQQMLVQEDQEVEWKLEQRMYFVERNSDPSCFLEDAEDMMMTWALMMFHVASSVVSSVRNNFGSWRIHMLILKKSG